MLKEYLALKTSLFTRVEKKNSFSSKIKSFRIIPSKMPLIWRLYEKGNYGYVCARVKARRRQLLPKEEYQRLLLLEQVEFARFLQDRRYDISSQEFSAIEKALDNGFEKSISEIIAFSEQRVKEIITEYVKRFDVLNVKTVIRGEFTDADPKDVEEALSIGFSVDKKLLYEASKKPTLQETVEALKGIEYYPVLKAAMKKDHTLQDLENALDVNYYRKMLDIVGRKSKTNRLFHDFLRREIDVVNIDTLLKLRRDGVEIKDGILLSGGFELDIKKLHALKNKNYEEILAALRGKKYSFSKLIKDDVAETTRSLEKNLVKSARRFSRLYPVSIVPIVHFMLSKETEMKNLRIIAGGKESGLSQKRIEEMLE
ncbi:MAG: V-type ATPase subunit [Candidatus Aenigmarchaeota archaeon]|nr:V-type ATPase subunit [Candidatus Aenigmarchaeota archaeon]